MKQSLHLKSGAIFLFIEQGGRYFGLFCLTTLNCYLRLVISRIW